MSSSPDLDALEAARVANARSAVASLRAKIATQQLLLSIFAAGVLICLFIDVAVIYGLGTHIGVGGDPTADPSWFERFTRVLAGCVVFVAISTFMLLGIKAIKNTAWPMALRACAVVTAALMAFGTSAIAAGLGWSAFGEVVNGLGAASHVATGMEEASSGSSIPLWVRITTAFVVMASGIAGALLELAAAKAFAELRTHKEQSELPHDVVALNQEIISLATKCRSLQAAFDAAAAPEAELANLKGAATQFVDAFVVGAQSYKNVEVPLAKQTPLTLQRAEDDAVCFFELLASARKARESIDRLARQHALATLRRYTQLPPASKS